MGDLLVEAGELGGRSAGDFVGLLAQLCDHRAQGRLNVGERLAAGELGAEVADEFAVDQIAARHDAGADGRAAVLALGAAVVPAADRDDGAAALATAQQPAEQRGRALALPCSAGFERGAAEAVAHSVPQAFIQDAELRVVLDDPLVARAVEARALAGVRVLHPLGAVPDQASDVELVVQDAAALRGTAVQGRDGPGAIAARLDAALVQVGGDALAAPAVGVMLEDLAHDRRLLGIDLEDVDVAGLNAAVAERHAAGVAAALELASESAVRLVAQIVQIDLIDQAAHGAVDLPRRAFGVVAVGDADDADPAVLEPANDSLLLDHVARQAVESFDQQDGDAPGERIRHQAGAAGAAGYGSGAGNAVIAVGGDGQPEFLGAGPADPHLVIEGGFALPVRAEPGVDGCVCHVVDSG